MSANPMIRSCRSLGSSNLEKCDAYMNTSAWCRIEWWRRLTGKQNVLAQRVDDVLTALEQDPPAPPRVLAPRCWLGAPATASRRTPRSPGTRPLGRTWRSARCGAWGVLTLGADAYAAPTASSGEDSIQVGAPVDDVGLGLIGRRVSRYGLW